MLIIHHPESASYALPGHPERPERVVFSERHLRAQHPDWRWQVAEPAIDVALLRAHSAEHLARVRSEGVGFDSDTPAYPSISTHASRAAGAALLAARHATGGQGPVFILMRPPGHHATRQEAMGFCYLNNVAVAALDALDAGADKVAIWDFDAHHGNGTEAIVHGVERICFASVHQFPGYPGTGAESHGNCHNFPVSPGTPAPEHMAALEQALRVLAEFRPDLLLISAGFDAYDPDPITHLRLDIPDFATLGSWTREIGIPTAAVLEGGYSDDLPLLIDAFLSEWAKGVGKAEG